MESGNINYVLIWVRADNEKEIKVLFEKVLQSLGVDFHHERFSGIVDTSIEREGDGLRLTVDEND